MTKVLMTLAEEREHSKSNSFAIKYKVDEHDCLDFARALRKLGHEVYFVNWDDLSKDRFTRMFDFTAQKYVKPVALNKIDLAFIYKMEGFYGDMQRFFAMVETLSRKCRLVVNDPRTIHHNIDKRYYFDLLKLGVNVIPTLPIGEELYQRIRNGESFVVKPIFGERGQGIFRALHVDDLQSIVDLPDLYVAQKFMPEIRNGERSLVFLGHEFQHAVLKKPPAADPSEFRCNESLGGTVEVYSPTTEELRFCHDLLRSYESLGCPVHFSRIDVIDHQSGPMLVEAELLNPSIYANYSNLGAKFGDTLARYFDQLINSPEADQLELTPLTVPSLMIAG